MGVVVIEQLYSLVEICSNEIGVGDDGVKRFRNTPESN